MSLVQTLMRNNYALLTVRLYRQISFESINHCI
jgi:hypothetical protein